jgi:anti-anti-sigma regulatory factor
LILDLSSAPYVDVAGSEMLLQLSNQLKKKEIELKIVEALSSVRDILRKQGMEAIIGHISRRVFVNDVVQNL